MVTLPIYNTEGKEIDTLNLDASVFDGTINNPVIYQVVCAYRANQRKGLASTKTMGEVSGGGRKPWRQKGTGRARAGSIRSPLWHHGGVVFGPHPRDFSYKLPQKIKRLAVKSSLNAKVKEGNFIVLDSFNIQTYKTKEALQVLSNLKIDPARNTNRGGMLLLLKEIDKNIKKALGNIASLDINKAVDTNAYEILAHRKLIITKDALRELIERLKK